MNRLTKALLQTTENSFITELEIKQTVPEDSVRFGLLHRAIRDGDIIRIRRGFYGFAPYLQKKPIPQFAISHFIYRYSYISLESALANHGWIPEAIGVYSSVTMNNNAWFNTPIGIYAYDRVKQNRFYFGLERHCENGYYWLQATPLKALADYVYVHKRDWINSGPLIESLRIEPEYLEELTANDFEELEGNYVSDRVNAFLQGLRKELEV
ncbi:hypothetical protein [uncultured Sphaerochaeta sp.]|uniref:type IV toxin-antitoxin system AbiEi family antitoxin domain-containing protein n=1 Tax=uncultured Sphaerochaeta sp. TaxID=886478 RepID=UPI002A0A354E|nr:hypothetical protein [uncultured Sphaerochaeta sp.]